MDQGQQRSPLTAHEKTLVGCKTGNPAISALEDKENLHCNTGTPLSRGKAGHRSRQPEPLAARDGVVPKALLYDGLVTGFAAPSADEEGRGLRAGQVVCLAVNGRLLQIRPSPGIEVVELVEGQPPSPGALASPLCQLTVLRNKEWVGLRIGGPGGKILQAKRRGRSRFCFYSDKFGFGEQWVVEPEPPEGWTSAQVVLRNRKLESIEIRCTIFRVPGPGGPLEATRSSFPPPSPAASLAGSEQSYASLAASLCSAAGASLPHNMSSVMISQWAAFVAKEVAARKRLEEHVHVLRSEMLGIRDAAAREVEKLRREAQAGAAGAVQASREELQQHLRRRAEYWRMRTVFVAWRRWSGDRSGCRLLQRALVARFRHSAAKRIALGILSSWKDIAADSAQQAAFVSARAQRRALHVTLEGWREEAARRSYRRRLLASRVDALCGRMLRRHFDAWRDESAAKVDISGLLLSTIHPIGRSCFPLGAHRATDLAVAFLRGSASRRMAARILLGWLGWAAVASAAKRLSARSGRRQLLRVLSGWRLVIKLVAHRQSVVRLLAAKRSSRLAALALFQWWLLAGERAAEQATLQGAALLGRRRLIGRCFLDWVTEAQLNRHRRRALVQQIWKVSNAVMQSSLQAWQAVAETSVRGRAILEACLKNLAARWRRGRLASSISLWHAVAQRSIRLQKLCLRATERLGASRARKALHAWHATVNQKANTEDLLLQAAARSTARRAAALAFEIWARHVAAQKSRLLAARCMESALARYWLRESFAAWRAATAGVEAMRPSKAVAAAHLRVACTRLLRRTFFSWYAVVLSTGAMAKAFRYTSRASRVLRAWAAFARDQRHLRSAEATIRKAAVQTMARNVIKVWRVTSCRVRAAKLHAWNAWQALYRWKRVFQLAQAFYQRRLKQRVLLGWLAVQQRRVFHHTRADLMASCSSSSKLFGAFCAWAKMSAETKEIRLVIQCRNRKVLLTESWVSWLRYCNFRFWKAGAASRCCSIRRRRLLMKGWAGLRILVETEGRREAALGHARRVIKRHAMSRSFQRWRLLSGQKAVAEARLSASRRDRAQASALAAWAEIAELRRAARSAARAMKLSLAVRRSADAFSFWRTAARKRRAAVAMFSRWHTRCARQVLSTWAGWAASRSTRRSKVEATTARAISKKVRVILSAWRDVVGRRKWCYQAASQKVASFAAATSRATLRQWQSNAGELRVLRQAVAWRVAMLRREAQVKVLDAWAAAVASRASLRLRLIRFASHRLRRLLTRAFFQWARLSQQLTGARQRAESLSAAVLEALVASCLRAWAEKRSVSRSAEALFERVCLRVLVRDPFFAWQAVAAHGRLREAMAGISGAAQLRKEVALAWRAWKGSMEAELCRAEALKTSLSARAMQRVSRLSFAAWEETARAIRMGKAEACRRARARQDAALVESFWAWRHSALDARQSLAKIRACVASKRVARDWFLGWYASAFEEEINTAVDMLYGACRKSLQAAFQPEAAAHAHAGARGWESISGPEATPGQHSPWRVSHDEFASSCQLRIPRSLDVDVSVNLTESNDSVELSEALSVAASLLEDCTPPNSAAVQGEPKFSASSSLSSLLLDRAGMTPAYGNPLFQTRDATPELKYSSSPMRSSARLGYEPASARRTDLLVRAINQIAMDDSKSNATGGRSECEEANKVCSCFLTPTELIFSPPKEHRVFRDLTSEGFGNANRLLS